MNTPPPATMIDYLNNVGIKPVHANISFVNQIPSNTHNNLQVNALFNSGPDVNSIPYNALPNGVGLSVAGQVATAAVGIQFGGDVQNSNSN